MPKWLNINNPKLNIAKHSDFIPQKYLPTFSSQPIELNLHRINGLAERFVYFNDDMFLLRPVKRELFFAGKDCLPTDFAITSTISTTTKEDMMPFIKLNCVTILNGHFDKKEQMKKHFSKWVNLAYGWNALRNLIFYGQHRFKGFANNHLAFSFLKSEYEDIWEKEYESLDDTSSHKFRSKLDLDNWLIRYWQLTRGNFYPIGRHVKGKYENHLLENLEVFVLGIGFINMLYKTANLNKDKINKFYLACGIFYIVMIARELSYGRVFYPIGIDKNGEQIFMNIHQIWYGPIVYPIIAVLVLIALFLMIQTYKYIKKEQIICSIPRYSIRLFIIMMILSQIVFEKNLIKFLADYGQLLEECTEILAYCSLVCFTYDISFKKK